MVLQYKVSQAEIRDYSRPLFVFVQSTQDIPGAAPCDVSRAGSYFKRQGSTGPTVKPQKSFPVQLIA